MSSPSVNKLMLEALVLSSQKKITEALALFDDFLSKSLPQDIECEAYSYRSIIREEAGDYPGAKEDLEHSHSLSDKYSYRRYTIEFTLGSYCEKLNLQDDAISWYKKALETSSKGRNFTGSIALRDYVRLIGEDQLSIGDRALCDSVVDQAWDILKITGRPSRQLRDDIETVHRKEIATTRLPATIDDNNQQES